LTPKDCEFLIDKDEDYSFSKTAIRKMAISQEQ